MVLKISSLDIFGISYSLKTNGKDTYKSVFGACLTVVVLAIAAQLTFLYGTDFFFMKNPTVLDSDVVHAEMQEIFPTIATHPFMIRVLINEKYNPTDVPIHVNGAYWDIRLNEETGIQETKCRVSGVTTNCAETVLRTQTRFTSEKLENWMCLDFEKVQKRCAAITKDPDYKPYIGGVANDKKMGHIKLYASNAFLDSEGKVLYYGKLAEVKNLGQFLVDIRYPKFYLRKEKQFDALTTTTEVERFNCWPQNAHLDYSFMKQVRLDDDTGWVNEQIETTHSIDMDKVTPQYYTNSLDKEGWYPFYERQFLLNRNEKVHKRRFMKLPEVISRVAGSMSPIIVYVGFLAALYNRFYNDLELINLLFNTNSTKKEKTQVNTIVDDSKAEGAKLEVISPKEVQLSFFSYYFLVCKESSSLLRSREFFNTARAFIAEKMDVRWMVEFNEKFSKLCEMTLTSEQQEELIRNKKTILLMNN